MQARKLAYAWRDLCIAARSIWLNLVLYVALLLVGALLLRWSGPYHEQGATFLDLIVGSFHMSHLESFVQKGDGWLPNVLTFVMPGLTLAIMGEGALRIMTAYMARAQHREEWALLVAQTLSGHTVIGGMGELGRAIFHRLIARDPNAAIVLIELRGDLLAELSQAGPNVCYIHGDMTSMATLERAGCRRAAVIIIGSGSDAVNLEAGFKAEQLNPNAKIYIRLYHSALATLMDCRAKPNVHFFSPYERAAEALITHIDLGGPNDRSPL